MASNPQHPPMQQLQQQQQAAPLPTHSDNVEEELRRIHLALTAVFSRHNANLTSQQNWWEQRQMADAYLTSFQTTSVSWMVCDRLLSLHHQTEDDMMVQQQRRFFAAQTLHLKCRVAIQELPPDSLPSLRDSLLQHLQNYIAASGGGNAALTTRLAMCVSALAVQMNWNTVLTDLLGPLQKQQQPTTTGGEANDEELKRAVVLSILQVLPEECASDRLLLADENIRYVMRDHFVENSAMVMDFLNSCMVKHSQTPKTIQQVLSTLHLWIRYVPVEPASLAASPLLPASVRALTQPTYMDVAADVIVEVLRLYPSHIPSNDPIVQTMVPLLYQNLHLQAALQSDDEDVWKAHCRIVTEMGESYMSLVLSSHAALPDNSPRKMVEWVLLCSKISEREIAHITLAFWYRMVMDLEGIDPYDWRQELIDLYTPHLLQLIDVCVLHLMKYPEDVDDLMGDRMDDLHQKRFYVAETVEDCCRLLGGQMVLQRIGNLFHQECQRVQHHHLQQSSSSGADALQWQGLESCFACIQCMHRFVPSDESEVLPLCFNLIPQLPPTIEPLRFTTSKTIGKYASWLVAHPELLQPLLPYLAHGLHVPHCAPAAAVAIKELCECSNQTMALGEPVLELYQNITANAHDPNNHPTTAKLELADELQILEGVCRALSRQIHDTNEDGTAVLSRIVQPIGTRLAAAVADPNAGPKQIIPEIERLTTVVQHLCMPTNGSSEGTHPIAALMQSTWSLMDTAATRFPQDINLAEKICRLHKHSLRSCGARAYEPLIDALMQFLVASYERSRQSPFLYAASICVAEYGRNPAFGPRLLEMVSAMARTSFEFLRTLDELTHHPDVVEEFFYLMGRMITYCPDPLVTSPLLLSLFQCAAVGMQVAHRDANKGTLNFLENTVSYGLRLREQPPKPNCQAALERVLMQEGQTIVTNMARAMMGELPTYSNQVPELLWKLNLLCPEHLVRWLTTAFASAMRPPERAKAGFMGALNSGLPRDDFNLAVRAFMNACERERKMKQRPAPQMQHQRQS